MSCTLAQKSDVLLYAAAPAAAVRGMDVSIPALAVGIAAVDKEIAVGLLAITAILLLISLIIVG